MFRGQKGDQYTGSPEAGSAPDKRTGKSKKEAGSLPVLPPKIDRQKKSSKWSAAESSDLADLNSHTAKFEGVATVLGTEATRQQSVNYGCIVEDKTSHATLLRNQTATYQQSSTVESTFSHWKFSKCFR